MLKNVLSGVGPKLPYDCSKVTWKVGYATGSLQRVVKSRQSHN